MTGFGFMRIIPVSCCLGVLERSTFKVYEAGALKEVFPLSNVAQAVFERQEGLLRLHFKAR